MRTTSFNKSTFHFVSDINLTKKSYCLPVHRAKKTEWSCFKNDDPLWKGDVRRDCPEPPLWCAQALVKCKVENGSCLPPWLLVLLLICFFETWVTTIFNLIWGIWFEETTPTPKAALSKYKSTTGVWILNPWFHITLVSWCLDFNVKVSWDSSKSKWVSMISTNVGGGCEMHSNRWLICQPCWQSTGLA